MESRNFKAAELYCPCCKKEGIKSELLDRLQVLRDMYGKPMIITSAYRCKIHNQKVGGVQNSQHVRGRAVDISTAKMSAEEKHKLLKLASTLEFKGIGVYKGFFHLDIRETESMWSG